MADQEKTISSQIDLHNHGSTIELETKGQEVDPNLDNSKAQTMDKGDLQNILGQRDDNTD